MLAPLLNRLAPGIRRIIYVDHLGARSMSIALLRQTCKEVRSEIDAATAPTWNGKNKPIFAKKLDARKLDGCPLTLIESAVGPIQSCNIDTHHWDELFCNALKIGHLDDIGQLLDIFVYPSSYIFPCNCLSSWFAVRGNRVPRTQHLDSFVQLVSQSENNGTIQHFYNRLPCDCVRRRFFRSAIKQCMFGVLDSLSQYFDAVFPQGRTESATQSLIQAVGSSGSEQMLKYVAARLDPKIFAAFYPSGYLAAASSNHVSLLRCTNIDQHVRDTAFEYAVRNDCREAMEYLQYSPLPASTVSRCLLSAAETGNSFAFRLTLSLQSDPLSTDWHASFGNIEGAYSLTQAFDRGIEDLVFFLNLYSSHFAFLLVPPLTSDIGDSKTWTFILRHTTRLTASRLTALLQSIQKYMVVDARELYLDTLHILLQRCEFQPDLVSAMVQPFLTCLASRPLSTEELTEMAFMTFTDQAYDWVRENFEVAISAQEATKFLGGLYRRQIYSDHALHASYFSRCLKLGATIEPGRSIIGDIVSMRMGIPYKPSKDVGVAYLLQMFEYLFICGGIEPVKMLVANLEAVQIGIDFLPHCSTSAGGGLWRSKHSGCFQRVENSSLIADGKMRLYHYACGLCGITPVDTRHLPDMTLDDV